MSKRAITTKEVSKEAPKEMPKKPPTFYFQFRANRMKELEGKEDRGKIIKEEWDSMTPELKAAGNAKAKKEMEKYNADVAEWKKTHPQEVKSRRKKLANDEDDEEEVKEEKPKGKGDKANGAPKAERGPKKEEGKGKSKGKKEERGESKKPKK